LVIVVTRATCLVDPFVPDALASSLWDALAKAEDLGKPVWIAGGGQLYDEALTSGCVDIIDFTLVPSTGLAGKPGVVRLRMEDLLDYMLVGDVPNPEDPSLRHRTYEA
jgi:dihydrofolate reductase